MKMPAFFIDLQGRVGLEEIDAPLNKYGNPVVLYTMNLFERKYRYLACARLGDGYANLYIEDASPKREALALRMATTALREYGVPL